MKSTRTLLVTLIITFAFTSVLCAQGKLFTKEEADQQFGKVVESVPMSLESFQALLDSGPLGTDKVGKDTLLPLSSSSQTGTMMFRIMDNDIVVLDGMRRSICNHTSTDFVKQGQVEFKVYARELVETLIRDGGGDTVMFENRESGVFSITCGKMTLEFSIPCPPMCR